jgi:hypothetical protein
MILTNLLLRIILMFTSKFFFLGQLLMLSGLRERDVFVVIDMYQGYGNPQMVEIWLINIRFGLLQ